MAKAKWRGVPLRPRIEPKPRERRIVLINQEPLRKRAQSDCQRALGRLEQARHQWKEYERDRSAFDQWVAQTFQSQFKHLAELAAQIVQKQELIDSVEWKISTGKFRSYSSAYAAALKEQKAGKDPRAEEDRRAQKEHEGEAARKQKQHTAQSNRQQEFSECFAEEAEGMEQFMRTNVKFLFEDFVEDVLGVSARSLSRAEYQRLFKKFKVEVLGMAEEPKGVGASKAGKKEKEEDVRIKDIYRALVKLLHPDAGASEETVSLWHEVQEAYSDRNLERLEMLRALCEVQCESPGAEPTLSEMKAIIKELRQKLKDFRERLQSAKETPSWGFLGLRERGSLERRVARELRRDVEDQRELLHELESILAEWSGLTPRFASNVKTRRR